MDAARILNSDLLDDDQSENERLKAEVKMLRAENEVLRSKLAAESRRRAFDYDHVPYPDYDR